MHVDISPENEQYLQQLVVAGFYASQSQAMDVAIELLKRREHLQRELQRGIDEADRGELLDGEEVFGRLEERASRIEDNARKSG
jgi:antitoxin ParD1/3/4